MKNTLLEIENGIIDLVNLFNNIKDRIGDRPVSKDIRDSVKGFTEYYNNYTHSVVEGGIEEIANAATMISVYAQSFARSNMKADINQEEKVLSENLLSKGLAFRKMIEDSPILTVPLTEEHRLKVSNSISDYKSLKKQLRTMHNEFEEYQNKVESLLKESEDKVFSLGKELSHLESDYNEKVGEISEKYKRELEAIEDKSVQLDGLLGNAASRVIVSEYAISAEQEKISANRLRIGSLICMGLIIIIAGYSFLESITQSFDISNALLRLVLVFLLSVPAAYLARESTKHRQQQYTHLQTSLDLKAINPYIASLPEEEQHKIKSEIAQKIFAPKDFQSINNESYPINSQEVIMALISKFEKNQDKQKEQE